MIRKHIAAALSAIMLADILPVFAVENGWETVGGKYYWYENGVKQGTSEDDKGVRGDGVIRGREIYDPESDAWYWLDAANDGAKATDKEVWIPYLYQGEEPGSTDGKWVRYDEDGMMVKGWYDNENGTYFYDRDTGAMDKGYYTVGGYTYHVDEVTGVLLQSGHWLRVDGALYWYENGVRQGTEGRGKEIYDPSSDGWYWLDAVQGGQKAVNKDVYLEDDDKWVHYDEDGRMIHGWYQDGDDWYYFDEETGAMYKGTNIVEGVSYDFDEYTGVLIGRTYIPRPKVEDNKTIYLTYDDGPGQYTDRLLDILAKYDVKATFFVTAGYPGYAYCMHRAYEEGHTVAVHTASHNYATIYASEDAYWRDFDRINQIIYDQTGHYTTLFRFPGGSSNTVSRNYNRGIMSRLVVQAGQKGYTYFDWNVDSNDAGGATNSDVIFNNVVSGIAANSRYGVPSVVLQHDIKSYSVNAVERIINWGLNNGYHFETLDANSYTAHHGVNN